MVLIHTVWLVLCLTFCSLPLAIAETPHIDAAADLKFALEDIAAAFRTDTHWFATTISLHKVRRYGLDRGTAVTVSLLAAGIHLMLLPERSAPGSHR